MIIKKKSEMNDGLFTILLVEDDIDHKNLIVRFFNNIKKKFDHVMDGEAALDYLFRRGSYTDLRGIPLPDLILLDLRLPKLDGLSVLKKIKSTDAFSQIPVVMLTTSSDKRDREKAYRYHANSYLVKPTDPIQFIALMKSAATYWLQCNYAEDSLV